MSSLDDQIEAMEQRVLNARTLEAAANFHDQLDKLRERRDKGLPPPDRAEYKRGYDSGYHAGLRAASGGGEGLDIDLDTLDRWQEEAEQISVGISAHFDRKHTKAKHAAFLRETSVRVGDLSMKLWNAGHRLVPHPTIPGGQRWEPPTRYMRDNARLAAAPPTPTPASEDGLRADGDAYEVRTWVRHAPSGVVVLKGHPQLGGRYCKTDGGDWPCAAVRAALAATTERPAEPEDKP